MRVRSATFGILVTILSLLLPQNSAFAEYHYGIAPASDNILGVDFHLILEYDSVSDHVRAEGIIEATGSDHAGRIYYVSLFENSGLGWDNVANFIPEDGIATNGFLSVIAGPVNCHLGFYYATMKYHVDGTSETRTIKTDEYVPGDCPNT